MFLHQTKNISTNPSPKPKLTTGPVAVTLTSPKAKLTMGSVAFDRLRSMECDSRVAGTWAATSLVRTGTTTMPRLSTARRLFSYDTSASQHFCGGHRNMTRHEGYGVGDGGGGRGVRVWLRVQGRLKIVNMWLPLNEVSLDNG